MKDVVLCALVTKGIELPGSQVGILRCLPQIVLVFTGPFPLNNRHFEKELTLKTRVNKDVNSGKYPPDFTKLSHKIVQYLLYVRASTEEKEGLDFNLNKYSCLPISFPGFIKYLSSLVSLKRIQG